jgi:hypothetical protein
MLWCDIFKERGYLNYNNSTPVANYFFEHKNIALSDGGSSYLISRFENTFSPFPFVFTANTIFQLHAKPIKLYLFSRFCVFESKTTSLPNFITKTRQFFLYINARVTRCTLISSVVWHDICSLITVVQYTFVFTACYSSVLLRF